MELVHWVNRSPGIEGKRGFEDLDCYKYAMDVMVNAHRLANTLPVEEKFDLAQQIRRSAKSISANIAEGYGRYHYLDTLKFYSNARGSLNETLSHVITSHALGYIDQEYFEKLYELIRKTEKTLNGLMNYVRQKKAGQNDFGDRAIREDNEFFLADFEEE